MNPMGPGNLEAAAEQWSRERRVLIQCGRALAFTYGGTDRPKRNASKQALWDAMHAICQVLDVKYLPEDGIIE